MVKGHWSPWGCTPGTAHERACIPSFTFQSSFWSLLQKKGGGGGAVHAPLPLAFSVLSVLENPHIKWLHAFSKAPVAPPPSSPPFPSSVAVLCLRANCRPPPVSLHYESSTTERKRMATKVSACLVFCLVLLQTLLQ